MRTQDSVKSEMCREHRYGRGSISDNLFLTEENFPDKGLFLISAATLSQYLANSEQMTRKRDQP